MGPYVPLVDYPNPYDQNPNDSNYLPLNADTGASNLPSAAYCGQIPTTKKPSPNSPALAGGVGNGCNPCVNYPEQYWPTPGTTAPPFLFCASTSILSPLFYFAATQRTTEAPTSGSGNCKTDAVPNPCDQIVAQSPQVEGQPPLPITIAGTGFGYLPQTVLPLALGSCTDGLCGSNYIEISNDNGSGLHSKWDTNAGAACQMYIANWTDNSISLVASVPINAYNLYLGPLTVLSPVQDISPLTFFPNPNNYNELKCPVSNGDTLTFSITNPQNPASKSSGSVTVSPAQTVPF